MTSMRRSKDSCGSLLPCGSSLIKEKKIQVWLHILLILAFKRQAGKSFVISRPV